jgi:hypothetical protein
MELSFFQKKKYLKNMVCPYNGLEKRDLVKIAFPIID